ncbi:kinase-like protein [Thelephora ganbajun]|uniref:Kinase-like protein n=1 Tax=Thelephora ganbajun TaxID=370292 RepID=A0ACB6Z1W1_THEGA|nr:kinase-like protein [Thelephora ganbajun]
MFRRSKSSRSDPVQESVHKGPISKHLVSHALSLNDQVRYIKRLLANREEQQAAKSLEPGDGVRFIELLDWVLRAGRLDEKDRPTFVRYLARVCGWHSVLPNSVRISSHHRISEHGGGGHSTVWIGRYRDQKVVIKGLNFYLSDGAVKKRELTKAFCKEVVIWKNLSHPNILPFIGATMVTEPNHEKYEMVSEFMENGDIGTFISQHKGVNRLELLKDVAAGLSYLHSQLVVHGDLKGLNVLINKHRRACLADFGLTRVMGEFTSSGGGEPKGTIMWMSPEIMWPEQFNIKDGRPTKESDVYSLGILIYEVVCGHRPFPELNELAAVNEFQQGKYPPWPAVGLTDPLWKTLQSCWWREREMRPSANTVLKRLGEASRV